VKTALLVLATLTLPLSASAQDTAPVAPAAEPSPPVAPAPVAPASDAPATEAPTTDVPAARAPSTPPPIADAPDPQDGAVLPNVSPPPIAPATNSNGSPVGAMPFSRELDPSQSAPLSPQGTLPVGDVPSFAQSSSVATGDDALTRPEFALPGGSVSGQEAPGGNFSLESPNGVIYDMGEGLAVAQGDVVFSFREFTVRGDRGVVDYNSNIATMSNNLTVTARDARGRVQTFRGQSLQFNLDTGQWNLGQIRATFPPSLFPEGQVLEPIYLREGRVTGTYDNAGGSDFRFSSCDRDHYFLESRRIEFFRDPRGNPDRIVLRRNALYVLGQKVLPLPVYVISLQGARSRRYGLQPTFGQNSTDGFFVRSVYDLSASGSRTDSLLLDALQKRGLGVGLQRELAGGAGVFYLYALSGQQGGREIDARVRRFWQISPSLRSSVVFDSTKNNSLAGEGYAARNGQLNFDLYTQRVQSTLLLTQNNSRSPFGNFAQQNITLTHRQALGNNWDIEADSLYARSRNSGSQDVATLDNLFGINKQGKRFDGFLRAELHNDLVSDRSYQLERLPELRLSSDAQRLGIPFFNRTLPGDINLAFGQYHEPSFGDDPTTSKRLGRAYLDYNLRRPSFDLVSTGAVRSELNVGAQFNQTLYTDNSARFQYAYDLNWNNFVGRAREGRNAPFNFQFNYLKFRPVGYTPFQFDFLSPNEFIDMRGIFEPSRKVRLEVSSGRDLQNNISRDIAGTLRVAPSRQFNFDLSTTYSPEESALGDVIGNFYVARERGRFLSGSLVLGFRYSAPQSTFTTINAAGDIAIGKKTRLQFFTGYNGFTQNFDFQQFRISRDLHCFNLFATYDNQRRELRFDLALKAFPFVDTRLGQNRFGEGFDPQIGTVR
jgi:hypothetical protein